MHHDMVLGVSRASWMLPAIHGTKSDKSKKMKSLYETILKRDDCTCFYCGWKSEQFQEVHHVNDNHQDFSMDNLKTVCPLCHQFFHLTLASSTNGGTLIWLPEITQQQLNHMCISIFIALKNEKVPIQGAARSLFGTFEARRGFIEENIAGGSSDPSVLAQALLGMKPEDYAQRAEFLSSFRLLPYASRFQPAISYWEKRYYKDHPVADWEKLEMAVDVFAIAKEIGLYR